MPCRSPKQPSPVGVGSERRKMKSYLRILATLAILLVTVSAITIGVFAEEKPTSITITTAECGVGDTVDVRFIVTGNVGFAKLSLSVAYNSSSLELVESKSGFNFSDFKVEKKSGGSVKFDWSGYRDNTENGAILILTFRVLDGAQLNKTAAVEITSLLSTNSYGSHVGISHRSGGVIVKAATKSVSHYGTSISVGDSLTLYFWVTADKLPAGDCYAAVTRKHITSCGNENTTVNIGREDWIVREGTESLIGIPIGAIASTEMVCDFDVTVYAGLPGEDGDAISGRMTASVESYAVSLLRSGEHPELNSLIVDMLNYGAAAQTSFTQKPEYLASSALTEEERAYASEDTGDLTAGMMTYFGCYYGTSLTVGDGVKLNYYFTGVSPADTESLTAKISYESHLGKRVYLELSREDVTVTEENGAYTILISIRSLTPADYGAIVSCELYGADKIRPIGSVTDSVALYIRDSRYNSSHSLVQNLYTQIIKYGNSVKSVFAVTDP